MRPALIPLVKARAIIADPEKWGKGIRSDGTACAAEAIEKSAANLATRQEAFALLSAQTGRPIVPWNDDPARTHAEVLRAFDRAIEAAS